MADAYSGSANLTFTHSTVKQFKLLKKFDLSTTVSSLKERLHFACGTAPENQILQLRDANETVINTLHPDDATIGSCGVEEGSCIYIVDTDPDASVNLIANMDNMSLETKYEIDEEAYKQRPDSFYQWKQVHLKSHFQKKAEKSLKNAEESAVAAEGVEVGMRCETGTDKDPRRGVVKWKGKIKDGKITYIGVRLDEPVGKNDGTAKGVRYFECEPNFGLFISAAKIKVGDYPEIDEFADSDDSDAEL